MTKKNTYSMKLSSQQVLSYFADEANAKKEKERNRRNLMKKQMHEATRDSKIVISNYSK